jgi:hypothetical protein
MMSVSIQQILKHIITMEAADWFMEEAQKQLRINLNKSVELPTEIGPLCDASVGWICKAYDFFKRNQIVRQVRYCLHIKFLHSGLLTIT